MITFDVDEEVDLLRPERTNEDLATLLGLLCGQKISLKYLSNEASSAITLFLKRVRSKGGSYVKLSYEEFNELLLLFNQHRIERPFFNFFFLGDGSSSTNVITFNQIKEGIKRFRGFAMLCFGNFRFAFRKLSEEKRESSFGKYLDPCNRNSQAEKKLLEKRQEPLTPLVGTDDEIREDKTWLLGYISGDLLKADEKALERLAKQTKKPDQLKPARQLRQLDQEHQESIAQGKRNTIKYLTWDFLDIYIATSMRYDWEYKETSNFIKKLFSEELREMPKLRWFDPTQSFCESTIDKGLVEGLMLKRAKCTIYMAQEGDTLGKDSELAATLAQGKPVIAYIREIKESDLKSFAEELKEKSVKYFRQRLLTLLADGFFDKPDNRQRVIKLAERVGLALEENRLKSKVNDLLTFFSKFEDSRQFQIIGDEETRFKEKNSKKIEFAADLMAAIESRAADIRADMIKNKHPLGIQVHLESGVANGVFVVRNLKECAALIRGVLTWDLKFDIKLIQNSKTQEKIATVLEEKVTKSRFRVVTSDECLTNSFWNFYLESEQSRWCNEFEGVDYGKKEKCLL